MKVVSKIEDELEITETDPGDGRKKLIKLWKMANQYNVVKKQLAIAVLPKNMILKNLREMRNDQDMLKKFQANSSFYYISITQVFLSLVVLMFERTEWLRPKDNRYKEGCRAQGKKEADITWMVVLLLVGHIFQVIFYTWFSKRDF